MTAAISEVHDRISTTLTDGQRRFEESELFQPITTNQEDSAMSNTVTVTPEAMEKARELLAGLRAGTVEYADITVPEAPKTPIAVALAVGLAKGISKAEETARNAKGSVTGFMTQFKAAYREVRPATVKKVDPKTVSPEELAAAMEILKQQNNQ